MKPPKSRPPSQRGLKQSIRATGPKPKLYMCGINLIKCETYRIWDQVSELAKLIDGGMKIEPIQLWKPPDKIEEINGIREIEESQFEILDGVLRFRAYQKLDRPQIPVIIHRGMTPEEAARFRRQNQIKL